jgi:hypothetical protein
MTSVWRGDLFYIQKLVATIEAPDQPLRRSLSP